VPPTLAIVSNRRSTRNLRAGDWIDSMIAGEPNVVHIPISDASEMTAAIRRCAAANADAIVVNGGDGTAGLALGALVESNLGKMPAVALLPGGKTNVTAAGWSLRGDQRQAFAALLQHRRAGTLLDHVHERAVLRLQRGGGAPPLYGALFGAAQAVDTILFCRKYVYPLGLPNAISHAVAIIAAVVRSIFGGGDGGYVAVKDENGSEEGRVFHVAVTALDELLFGVRPVPETNTSADAVHLICVRHGAVLRTVPDILQRRLRSGPGRSARRVQSLTLAFNGAYTLDGELYEVRADQPLTLDCGPRVRFIRFEP
jgi:hypothetical protein